MRECFIMTNNLETMKKAVEKAREEYRKAVQYKISEIIFNGLSCINIENGSYYVEIKTENELLIATDVEVAKNDELVKQVETILNTVANDIWSALREIDEWNSVEFHLYCDNVISYNIEVDGMQFEYKIFNRYNK